MEIADFARDEFQALCSGPSQYLTAALGERHRLSVVHLAVRRSNQTVSLSTTTARRCCLPLRHRAVLVALPEVERGQVAALAIENRPEAEAEIRRGLARAEEDYARHGVITSFVEGARRGQRNLRPVNAMAGDRLYGLNVGGPSFFLSREELIENSGERERRAPVA